MSKKNNTVNKSVYKDFDDDVIPNDFIFEGCQLKRNKDCQFIENTAGRKVAIKCPYTRSWCKGKSEVSFSCFGCIYHETLQKPKEESVKEAVNHPLHYGGDTPYECIKVLAQWMTKEEYRGFLRGNAIKYLCRTGKKDETVQELKKTAWYVNKLIESYEEDK